ncbi:MAG: hypothetical protein AAGH88_14610 [Planctomycetota bacterium]
MLQRPSILTPVLLAVLIAWSAMSHPEDEVQQVQLEVTIDQAAVVQQARVPLAYALETVYEDIELWRYNRMDPGEAGVLLANAMARLNPVRVDGVEVLPVIKNLRLEGFTPDIPVATLGNSELIRSGVLAFEAHYTTLGQRPQAVSLTWRMIAPERADAVLGTEDSGESQAGVIAASLRVDGKAQLAVFSEREPEHIWHSAVRFNPVSLTIAPETPARGYRLPVLGMVVVLAAGLATFFIRSVRVSAAMLCGGVGLSLVLVLTQVGSIQIDREPEPTPVPPSDEARAIFTVLHRNIYRAFDYTDESAVYDALAQSVDGPELAVIYNDVYQSLVLRDQGGAVCRVQDVRVESAEVLGGPVDGEPGGYRVRCTWEVDGLVQHHGHTHARTNRFSAVYTLAPRNGQWRIIGTAVQQQARTDDGNQTLEDLFDLDEQPGGGDGD